MQVPLDTDRPLVIIGGALNPLDIDYSRLPSAACLFRTGTLTSSHLLHFGARADGYFVDPQTPRAIIHEAINGLYDVDAVYVSGAAGCCRVLWRVFRCGITGGGAGNTTSGMAVSSPL